MGEDAPDALEDTESLSWLWDKRPGGRLEFDPARLAASERRRRERKADKTFMALLASLNTGVWDRLLASDPRLAVIRPLRIANGVVHAPPPPRKEADAVPLPTLAARRALAQFDDDLAAFDAKYPNRAVSTVTVNDLAKDRGNVDRQKYYRLLKKAGSTETPVEYIQRRLPELRDRRK